MSSRSSNRSSVTNKAKTHNQPVQFYLVEFLYRFLSSLNPFEDRTSMVPPYEPLPPHFTQRICELSSISCNFMEIVQAKGTPAARKRASELQKAFFSDPENRRKRSIAMKGIQFYCSYCGREGHRSYYCPELRDSLIDRRFRCRICGEKGHNRRTCKKPGWRYNKSPATKFPHCRICGQSGHNRRTCRKRVGAIRVGDDMKNKLISARKTYTCRLCQCKGHNFRSCPSRDSDKSAIKLQFNRGNK